METQEVLEMALNNLKIVDPNFDPFNGHRFGDCSGKSAFNMPGEPIDMLHALLKVFGSKLVKEDSISKDGTHFFMFTAQMTIGLTCLARPVAEGEYTVEMYHGAPQAVGKLSNKCAGPTSEWTAVLTEEHVNNGDYWCLASVYPGRPDSGILPKELLGKTVKGSTLIDLGYDRVVVL